MENICALVFTVVLLLPLLLQLQMLIVEPKKLCTLFHYYATSGPEELRKTSSSILQYYPREAGVFSVVDSDSKMLLTNLRTVSSSPVISNGSSSGAATERGNPIECTLTDARHSSTFVKTGQVLPVVDITWNYSSYRYKTFEACLRNYYGDKYPPGEVLLNSMQLNLLDSHTNVAHGVAGLFDFVKEEPRHDSVPRRLEIEYLNPLDHFVVRQQASPPTVERFTETDCRERSCGTTGQARQRDPIVPVITAGQEKNQPARRSSRKIEPSASKYHLSSSRRVCGTNAGRTV